MNKIPTAPVVRSHNEWCTCRIGELEIVVSNDGSVSHLHHGRIFRSGSAAEEYLAKHDQLRKLSAWLAERTVAINRWKHATPHHRYSCDGGCLAIRVNGVAMSVRNRYGDGGFPVYVLARPPFGGDEPGALPPTFEPAGVTIDSDAELEILDDDCSGANVLERLRVKSAEFFTDGHGAVIVSVTR